MSALLKHQQLISRADVLSIRGMVADWELSDASGTVAVDSGPNAFHGTYVGSCILGQTSILPGGSKTSTLFSSASPGYGYVTLPPGFYLAAGNTFTVLAFIRLSSYGSGAVQIICSSTGGINLYVDSSSHKLVAGLAGVSNAATDTRALSLNTNYMVGLTINSSGDVKFYVNKVPSAVFSAAIVGKSFTSTTRLFDYSNNTTNYRLFGNAQRVIVCNVALSDAEIATIYDAS